MYHDDDDDDNVVVVVDDDDAEYEPWCRLFGTTIGFTHAIPPRRYS